MMRSRAPGRLPVLLGLLLSIVALAAGCSPTAPPPSGPQASAGTSNAPGTTTIDTPEAAVALILASDVRFAGLVAKDPNLIGQCCFYVINPSADGFAVTIEIGWGDCPAGCINRHHWFYTVRTDGTFHLDREDGPPVPAGVPGTGGGTTAGPPGIRGTATAGPVCPVARPNDPACADRPVVGATIHVLDATGTEVATLVTDAAGAFAVPLPPGRYRIVADPVAGLLGTAPAQDVTVGANQALVQLTYDTGIR